MEDSPVKRSRQRRAVARQKRALAERELADEQMAMPWVLNNWQHVWIVRMLGRLIGPGKRTTAVVLWGSGLFAVVALTMVLWDVFGR